MTPMYGPSFISNRTKLMVICDTASTIPLLLTFI